jgi:hypothetical protein
MMPSKDRRGADICDTARGHTRMDYISRAYDNDIFIFHTAAPVYKTPGQTAAAGTAPSPTHLLPIVRYCAIAPLKI